MKYMLAIETSCDDTSVALVGEDGTIAANVVSGQIKEHAPYLGVVPELASRAHLDNLPLVYREAMGQAGLGLEDLAAVSVTQGPGLVGCLMVGINFAKALAMGAKLPLVGVNHIKGHVAALFLEHQEVPLPALALIVSGGHTHLLHVDEHRRLTLLTKTRDDSAGEAFDKLAKMMGLGFPGGPVVDRLASEGDPKGFAFAMPKFRDGAFDYSFSGMKTRASRYIEAEPAAFANANNQQVKDLCASFQAAVVKHLLSRVRLGIEQEKVSSLLLGGGVACNSALRRDFTELGKTYGLPALLTSPKLSTDNAAMIACEGWRLFREGITAPLEMGPDIRLRPYEAVRLLQKHSA